jgi:Branched-chain amino acid transport system / permease component
MSELWDAIALVLIALVGGVVRVSTPFLFVSLGECLTEKSGRINLGLEGTLVLGAMSGYATSYLTGSPWLGIAAAALTGMVFGAFHAVLCQLPRVNDIAVGIALIQLGTGAAFFFGKPFIQPTAPHMPLMALGWWSSDPQLQNALMINPLFPVVSRWRSSCAGRFATPIGVSSCARPATASRRRAISGYRSTACGSRRPVSEVCSLESAAPFCRCPIRGAGMRVYRPDKA